jgi:hypothetical protein
MVLPTYIVWWSFTITTFDEFQSIIKWINDNKFLKLTYYICLDKTLKLIRKL